jgi:hypothetical protein
MIAIEGVLSSKVIQLLKHIIYPITEVITMKSHWRKTITEITIWLCIEVLLNLSGLDQLGNYSEFVFEQKNHNLFELVTTTMIS